MKKSTIWTIAIIMGLSFLGLLYMQISYIEEIAKMKKEQFDESVNRSLYQASRKLEMNETLRYLEKDVNDVERRAFTQDSIIVNGLDGSVQHAHQFSVSAEDGTFYSAFELKTFATKPANTPKAMMMRTDKDQLSEATKSLQECPLPCSASSRGQLVSPFSSRKRLARPLNIIVLPVRPHTIAMPLTQPQVSLMPDMPRPKAEAICIAACSSIGSLSLNAITTA